MGKIMFGKQQAAACIVALMFSAGAGQTLAQATASDPDSLRETYSDWSVQCSSISPNVDRTCVMSQRLIRAEDRQNIMSLFVRQNSDGSPGHLTMITPFGVDLAKGATMAVNGAVVVEASYRTCRPQGCVIQHPLDQLAIDAMRKGDDAVILLPLVNGQTLELNASLAGFAAAWRRLSEL